jgi:hypothetical protein
MLMMMPQDFPPGSPAHGPTVPVIVLAWPVDGRAAPAIGDTAYAATVAFPADPRRTVASSGASYGAPDDRALSSLVMTLTSAIQELTDNLQAAQTPPPPRLGPLNDPPLWATSSHMAERTPRARRVSSRGQGGHQ